MSKLALVSVISQVLGKSPCRTGSEFTNSSVSVPGACACAWCVRSPDAGRIATTSTAKVPAIASGVMERLTLTETS